ncbi:uncharacterized protein LOC111868415 isoform X2 [Cryptotermes secundus]|uniref:uncharacterized protein LOC111868415 isoform X2 n=1 Tax=Cryptotermes secundus TaxID=105785 RepID=UPI001454D33B|nr:uncharacterized protein LOC111868415 isoform X2 [Cryptotermes secundus]
MELVPEGKNFRLAQENELPEILDFLSEHLPDSLKPHGRLYESFSVFCPCEQLDDLRLVEEEDVLIDWSRPIYLNFTHHLILEHLENFYTASIGTTDKVCGDIYVCTSPLEDVQPEELPPDGAEMLQLKPEHAKEIHDLYPANDMESVEVFEKLITVLPAYGIFSSGELAAWMVQSYYGAMFSMQTRPEFRRKGYGIHLAQYLTKVVTLRGYIPYVVIRPENDASLSLYKKLGFKKHYQTVRAVLRPHGYDDANDAPGGGGNDDDDDTAAPSDD